MYIWSLSVKDQSIFIECMLRSMLYVERDTVDKRFSRKLSIL